MVFEGTIFLPKLYISLIEACFPQDYHWIMDTYKIKKKLTGLIPYLIAAISAAVLFYSAAAIWEVSGAVTFSEEIRRQVLTAGSAGAISLMFLGGNIYSAVSEIIEKSAA